MGAESADKFARAFRVRNKKTDERFYQYMKDNAYSVSTIFTMAVEMKTGMD